jgi:hypothetical protein
VKYAVVTFGCRVNQSDSLGFEEELLAAGAVPAPAHDADLVVVNSCSVTATADQGTRQTSRRIARDNPGARIVVTRLLCDAKAGRGRGAPRRRARRPQRRQAAADFIATTYGRNRRERKDRRENVWLCVLRGLGGFFWAW